MAIEPAFVGNVLGKLGVPDSAANRDAALAALQDTQLVLADGALSAEIADLADRLAITAPGPGFGAKSKVRPLAALTRLADWVEGRRRKPVPNVAILHHFIGRSLPSNRTAHRSFRLHNLGPTKLAAAGPGAGTVIATWHDPAGRELPALRTAASLPVDLEPNRSLTVIVPLRTPEATGSCTLRVGVEASGTGCGERSACSIPVEITATGAFPSAIAVSAIEYAYVDDHHQGNVLLRDFLLRRFAGRRLRLLEIGGGIHPQVANTTWMGHQVVATDVSAAMGRLGRLVYSQQSAPSAIEQGLLTFVACDANALPFADQAFDGIGMFAAFHHFAEPDRFLRGLRRVLAPGGFVALMCEPCAPHLADEAYLRDLRKGINEQSFAPEEYLEIFERAGFGVLEGRIDAGSLKVILA
jgi:SAM-dependent methyltransferase